MSRGLTGTQISALQTEPYRSEYLIELIGYTTSYWTTGVTDVTAYSYFQGGNISYVSNNRISVIGNIVETLEIEIPSISIEFQTSTGAQITNAVVNDRVTIQKLFRNASTYVQLSDPIPVFDGRLVSISATNTVESSSLVWNITGNFSTLETVKGRLTNNASLGKYTAYYDGVYDFNTFNYSAFTQPIKWGVASA